MKRTAIGQKVTQLHINNTNINDIQKIKKHNFYIIDDDFSVASVNLFAKNFGSLSSAELASGKKVRFLSTGILGYRITLALDQILTVNLLRHQGSL